MGRLQAALLENHLLEDKAAEITRNLAALAQNEDQLKESVKHLDEKAAEAKGIHLQLDRDLEDLERKTATIIKFEGLSVEEKEHTQQKLLQDISEAQRAKEKLMSNLSNKTQEMASMHQIHANVSERIFKLQNRYKTNFNQLLQKVSADISAKTFAATGKTFGSHFT